MVWRTYSVPGTLLLIVTGMWKAGMAISGYCWRSSLDRIMAVSASNPPAKDRDGKGGGYVGRGDRRDYAGLLFISYQ
jgi:hypothetical protein